MNVHVDLCLIPIGTGTSLSVHIAACQRVLREAGLEPHLHAFGTNIEGDWDTVMAAIKRCHEEVHALGAARIHTALKIGTRTDRAQSLADKVASVEAKGS